MERPWGETNALATTRDGWKVDGLCIKGEVGEQAIGQGLAQNWIADDDRYDMGCSLGDGQASPLELTLQEGTVFMLQLPLGPALLQMTDTGERTCSDDRRERRRKNETGRI